MECKVKRSDNIPALLKSLFLSDGVSSELNVEFSRRKMFFLHKLCATSLFYSKIIHLLGMFSFFYVGLRLSRSHCDNILLGVKLIYIMWKNWIMQLEQLILRAFIMQMSILSRMYPCKECADHFQEILRCTISSSF